MTTKRLLFDAGVSGELVDHFTFARNMATRDGLGAPVIANSPRYDRVRAVGQHVANDATVAIVDTASTQGGFGGFDADGITPIFVHFISDSARLKVYVGNLDIPVVTQDGEYSAGIWDIMDGNLVGHRYIPVGGVVCHGMILLFCVHYSMPANLRDAVAVLVSQDHGATWAAVDTTAGEPHLPINNTGDTRGAGFCLNNWYPEVDGQDPPLAAWFGLTDYLTQPAQGGQHAILRATRPDANTAWSVGAIRVVRETVDPGMHAHSAYPVIDLANSKIGLVSADGDGDDQNRMVLSWMDISDPADYVSATINHNYTFHGAHADDVTGTGKAGHQFVSAAPGPAFNEALVTGDYNPEAITLVEAPDGTADWSTLKARVHHCYAWDDNTEDFSIICRDPVNRQEWVSAIENDDVAWMIYSADGLNWFEVQNIGPAPVPNVSFFGEFMIRVRTGTGIYSLPLPSAVTRRPLLLGPGTNNRVDDLAQWTAPEAGLTFTLVEPNASGLYEYPAGHPRAGEVLPDQPQSMCQVWRVTGDGTNDSIGLKYIQEPEPADTAEQLYRTFGTFPLDGSGVDGVFQLNASKNSYVVSQATENWSYHQLDATSGSYSGNLAFGYLARPGGSGVGPVDFLLTVVSDHSKDETECTVGYPVPPLTDASAIHELANLVNVEVGTFWQMRFTLGGPLFGYYTSTVDTYYFTLKEDASNYIEVFRSDTNELTVSIVVDGAAAVVETLTVADLQSGRYISDMSWRFVVAKLPTGVTRVMITNRGTVIGSVDVAAVIDGALLDIQLGSNQDQTVIMPLRVFDIAVSDEHTTPDLRVALLSAPAIADPAAVTALTTDDLAAIEADIEALRAEVDKIPRAAAALTPGGDVTWNKQVDTADALTIQITGE